MDGTPRFRFRDARASDFSLAEALYLGTMEPLLSELGDWDPGRYRERIRALFNPQESRVITVDSRDIGFMQVTETADDLNIAQLHLAEGYRGLGIGTLIVADLIDRADRQGKSLSLSAPRNNRAIALYRRLGFRISRDDGGSIIDMRRDCRPAGQHISD